MLKDIYKVVTISIQGIIITSYSCFKCLYKIVKVYINTSLLNRDLIQSKTLLLIT
jgi:hypothetical protein